MILLSSYCCQSYLKVSTTPCKSISTHFNVDIWDQLRSNHWWSVIQGTFFLSKFLLPVQIQSENILDYSGRQVIKSIGLRLQGHGTEFSLRGTFGVDADVACRWSEITITPQCSSSHLFTSLYNLLSPSSMHFLFHRFYALDCRWQLLKHSRLAVIHIHSVWRFSSLNDIFLRLQVFRNLKI